MTRQELLDRVHALIEEAPEQDLPKIEALLDQVEADRNLPPAGHLCTGLSPDKKPKQAPEKAAEKRNRPNTLYRLLAR